MSYLTMEHIISVQPVLVMNFIFPKKIIPLSLRTVGINIKMVIYELFILIILTKNNIRHNHYVLLHRLLFGEENIPAKMEIDHINGKPYDNRRSNLRLVTHADNMKNQAMRADNKSGYADVWKKIKAGANRGQHKLPVMAFGITLAIFDTPEEAAKAVAAEREQSFAEFSRASEDMFNGTRRPC